MLALLIVLLLLLCALIYDYGFFTFKLENFRE